jgi:hypothetical protein
MRHCLERILHCFDGSTPPAVQSSAQPTTFTAAVTTAVTTAKVQPTANNALELLHVPGVQRQKPHSSNLRDTFWDE